MFAFIYFQKRKTIKDNLKKKLPATHGSIHLQSQHPGEWSRRTACLRPTWTIQWDPDSKNNKWEQTSCQQRGDDRRNED
jgi:hypothetical protein